MKKLSLLLWVFGISIFCTAGYTVTQIVIGKPLCKTSAQGQLEVTVIDDNGNPVPNIKVKGHFPSEFGSKYSMTIYGITDRNGKVTLKGLFEDILAYAIVEKQDYYEGCIRFDYPSNLKYDKKGKRVYLPYRDSGIVILRKVIDPVPLWDGEIRLELVDKLKGRMGFDFLKGDYVKPYGTGEIADCYFSGPRSDIQRSIVSMIFINPGDGIQWVENGSPYSELPSSHYASDSGYIPKLDKLGKGIYFFRIRSQNGKNGIYGRINSYRSARGNNLNFTYVLNPTGSRNLEMDQRYGRSVKIGEPWKPLGRGARADLLFKVVDPQGNPIPKMDCSFYQPSDDEHFPRGAEMQWVSNANGMSPLFHNWIYNKMEFRVAESDRNYYTTQILHYPDTLHYDESGKEVWKPWTDTIVIVPKMKIKPVKAKEVDFKAAFTPLPGMRLPYDILMNQPVYPYGDGKVTDCYLSGTRKLASDTEYEYTMTLEFAKPWEGIKPRPKIVEPPDYSFSFKGEYKIPEEGFQSKWTFTKRLRRDKCVSDRFIEDYYIRFRTKKDSQGRVTKGEFGTFNCYFVDFDSNGSMQFSVFLSLNPDGENNIEFIR